MKANAALIENMAAMFRQRNGLSSTTPISLKSLLFKLRVLTLFQPLSEKFAGMCIKSPAGDHFMLINSAMARGRQRYTIAHELYHLYIESADEPFVCHVQTSACSKSEKDADKFASCLLMPRDGVIEMVRENVSANQEIGIGTVLMLEHYYTVSRAALLNRLKDLGLINETQRAGLAAEPVVRSAQQYGYDTSLYKPANEGLVIGDYGQKARYLFENDYISEGHYRELLHKLNPDDDICTED